MYIYLYFSWERQARTCFNYHVCIIGGKKINVSQSSKALLCLLVFFGSISRFFFVNKHVILVVFKWALLLYGPWIFFMVENWFSNVVVIHGIICFYQYIADMFCCACAIIMVTTNWWVDVAMKLYYSDTLVALLLLIRLGVDVTDKQTQTVVSYKTQLQNIAVELVDVLIILVHRQTELYRTNTQLQNIAVELVGVWIILVLRWRARICFGPHYALSSL